MVYTEIKITSIFAGRKDKIVFRRQIKKGGYSLRWYKKDGTVRDYKTEHLTDVQVARRLLQIADSFLY